MKSELTYCKILNTNINVTDMDRTIAYITEHLDTLKGDYICVSNVHTTVMAFRDEEYRRVQNSGAMALPDGQPLSIVSRRRGYSEAQRVPGPDLMPAILKLSEEKGYTHYFYGSSPETLAKLKKVMLEQFPKLRIAGMYAPPFRPLTPQEDQEIIQKINDSGADFIWVALGAPKQEKWIYENREKLSCSLALGLGGSLDVYAGTVKRAPDLFIKLNLEWFYRLIKQPSRIGRMMNLPRFLFGTLFYKISGKDKKEQQEVRP